MKRQGRETGISANNQQAIKQVKREKFQEIVKETIGELYSNPRFWDFFKSFNEDSVHDFIIEYASKKAWYLVNGERILSGRDSEHFRFRDIAYLCLWEIQQKKLFNMQSEWRAGLIEIEEIKTTRDFLYWERAIARCPFLEPINAGEVELYKSYLNSDSYCEKNWFYNWQDYDIFRSEGSAEQIVPAWYRYYDEKIGTGYLSLLPDKKGLDEKECFNAWCESFGFDDGDIEDDKQSRPLPNLHLNFETLNFFIQTFESRQVYKYFEAAECPPDHVRGDKELDDAIKILKHAPHHTSLPQVGNWREAIIQAATQIKKEYIISNLSLAWDDYLFRLQSGIAFDESESDHSFQEYYESAMVYRQRISKGQEILANRR